MNITKITSIGFTLTHSKGTIEINYQNLYGNATVFVARGKLHGYTDLNNAIKNKFVTTSEREIVSLLPEEMEFLHIYQPVFEAFEKADTEAVAKLILGAQ